MFDSMKNKDDVRDEFNIDTSLLLLDKFFS